MFSIFKSRPKIKFFRTSKEATIPAYSTEGSACFDLHACLSSGALIRAKIKSNRMFAESDTNIIVDSSGNISLKPGCRALIPTGMKLHIPSGYSVRLHPRSGLSFNHGISLCNCEGVIDEDYVDEIFISLHNTSNATYVIKHRDRVCQAELVKDCRANISETFTAPSKKTSRFGGFGSTGS